jgi:hypothetical protein
VRRRLFRQSPRPVLGRFFEYVGDRQGFARERVVEKPALHVGLEVVAAPCQGLDAGELVDTLHVRETLLKVLLRCIGHARLGAQRALSRGLGVDLPKVGRAGQSVAQVPLRRRRCKLREGFRWRPRDLPRLVTGAPSDAVLHLG